MYFIYQGKLKIALSSCPSITENVKNLMIKFKWLQKIVNDMQNVNFICCGCKYLQYLKKGTELVRH